MALFAGGLLPWVKPQFFDDDGNPVSGGFLFFYVAGTTTPLDTFSTSGLTEGTENTNPIELDDAGRSENSIYLQPTGYKVILQDADGEQLWSVDDVEDVGQVFAANFGTIQSEGGSDVTSGYQILVTDRLVTVDSTGGADPCLIYLPVAADATQMLTVKNMGTVAIELTPNGADTIDGNNTAFDIPAASPTVFPSVILVSDAVSSWTILASHGLS